MIRVCLFSQDVRFQRLIEAALEREQDFEIHLEADRQNLAELLRAREIDVLLVDLDASRVPPQQILQQAQAEGVPVVVLANDGSRATALGLVDRGAYSYCRRPPLLPELVAVLHRAYETAAATSETETGVCGSTSEPEIPGFAGLIGCGAKMQSVYELVRRVAHLNTPVLITGESGTGKELIARALHNVGNRAKSPFVPVSCGAIPETLIESELFGHEKGAFTGTAGTRIGFFEQAGDGTLFLDEIGELSLQTQVKLLRVLQQREFTRLGSNRPIPLRARVVFATHRDLSRMVGDGRFRLDFYYRINIMTIQAPTLADRPEDIPGLAQHFLRYYSDLHQKRVTGISPEALEILQQYEWPGNVRELENVIQRSIIYADGEMVQAKDLPEDMVEQDLTEREDELPNTGNFERQLRQFKFRLAMKALEDCKGNKTLAARNLNISRAYLHRLLRASGDAISAA